MSEFLIPFQEFLFCSHNIMNACVLEIMADIKPIRSKGWGGVTKKNLSQ